ncbi:MAG: hypothetical protein HOO99_01450 [Hyphomicrobiaceae bacterium]|nr:hypothetical protein [Hyphomicrobiaceae bacterium]
MRRALILGLTLALTGTLAVPFVGTTPALAQRGPAAQWELLGDATVGYGADRDVISIGRPEGHFKDRSYRRLRFVASNGDFRMKMVKLRYLNGHEEDVQIDQQIRSGQEFVLDLKGERSFLSQIEMFYGSRFGIDFGSGGIRINKPKVTVYGDNRGFGLPPAPRPPVAAGWDELGRGGINRGDDSVTLRVGRREGRLGQIRLRNEGAPVTIRSASVQFGNGETQNIRIGESLEDGAWTRALDLEGDRRFIENITVNIDGRGRRGRSEVIAYGIERAGGPVAPPVDDRRRGWVPLGEQSVGFRADKDVIRVNQKEDFFRDKRFGRLHFVAEGNEIYMSSIKIIYLNGHQETLTVNQQIRAGGDLAVDLRGQRSYIGEIEMNYRARPGFGGRAIMKVFGEPAR